MSMITITFTKQTDSSLCCLVLVLNSGRSLPVLPARFPICKARVVILSFVKTV